MFNIFTLAFLAVAFGLVLAVWVTRQDPPEGSGHVIPEDDSKKDPENVRALSLADLKKLGEALCNEHKLKSIEVLQDEREETWVLENDNEIYGGKFVFGFLERPKGHVTLAELLQFKDFVKSMRAGRGFLFTTGYFTRDVHQPLEGVAVTLYNRLRVIEDLTKRNISL